MEQSMTGQFGFQDGLRYSKTKRCKCGNFFTGPGALCDECFFKENYMEIEECVIENAEGRCELMDHCEHYWKCLAAAAARGWAGWRKINVS